MFMLREDYPKFDFSRMKFYSDWHMNYFECNCAKTISKRKQERQQFRDKD
jgi:hypothetical protein